MIVGVLSQRVIILVAMSAEVTRFVRLREGYESCPDFGEIYVMLRDGSVREMDGFLLQDGYIFWFCKLCILHTSLRNSLLRNTCWRSGWTLQPE